MFKNLTYKQKFIILVITGLLFLVLLYQAAIKKTIDVYQNLDKNIALKEKLANAPLKMAVLRKQLFTIERRIGVDSLGAGFEQEIVDMLGRYCIKNGIQFSEMPMAIHSFDQGYEVKTGMFVCGGKFVPVVKMLAYIEKQAIKAHLCSVGFYSEKENNNSDPELKICLYFQNYSRVNN